MLEPAQRAALASLRELWPQARIVLIGATALRLQTGLQRETHDMDLVIAVDVAAFPAGLGTSPEWTQARPDLPQRWIYRKRTKIDLLPVGSEAIARGQLHWPNGEQMSVEAFDLLATARLVLLLEEEQVHMAPVPLVMLLKMVAWLDRPGARERDIADLAWLFSNYLNADDDDDFNRLAGVGFTDAGRACLLGQDIAGMEDGRGISPRFLQLLEKSYAFQYAKARRGAYEDGDNVLAAFKRGLGIS